MIIRLLLIIYVVPLIPAFASSRRWKITLFRSAMRSKFRVKASNKEKTMSKPWTWDNKAHLEYLWSAFNSESQNIPKTYEGPNDVCKTPKRMTGTGDGSVLTERLYTQAMAGYGRIWLSCRCRLHKTRRWYLKVLRWRSYSVTHWHMPPAWRPLAVRICSLAWAKLRSKALPVTSTDTSSSDSSSDSLTLSVVATVMCASTPIFTRGIKVLSSAIWTSHKIKQNQTGHRWRFGKCIETW